MSRGVWWRVMASLALAGPAGAQPAADPVSRADALVAKLTEAEKLSLVTGSFASQLPGLPYQPPAEARAGSAGYVAGIARLGIPAQWETDAGIGVASQMASGLTLRERTALPAGIATAASFDPAMAYRAGAMIGAEARASGFDVMLAGGVNLARDPRNGRNFEYAGEDPWLAGSMVGAEIAGIQSNHVIATTKHYAMNDQEFGRTRLSAEIGEAAARESDLLAFEFTIERGDPGAVMCSYNRVNTIYACENDWLLNRVLKQDWHYPYYVMSDWGAVHSTAAAANAGLDQESGASFDSQMFFGEALGRAVASGAVPQARLDDMAHRILRAMAAKGVLDHPPSPDVAPAAIDLAGHAAISQADEEEAIVLLKNAGQILPLRAGHGRIAVIGGHADRGVLSGGGSSQVYPKGGPAVPMPPQKSFPGDPLYDPSSPLAAIAARAGGKIAFADGSDVAAAAALAGRSDLVILFATRWSAESRDNPLSLSDRQEALIASVARANPRTIVVLETGGPVMMPWLGQVAGVLEAWYPGSAGGPAIARVLFGEVDAGGRLPISFPVSAAQLPRPKLDGDPAHPDAAFTVSYFEGAAVGYKWYDRTRQTPLFPFGFGLSYGHTAYSGLHATIAGGRIVAGFAVKNTAARAVVDVPQLYLGCPGFDDGVAWRLVGFSRVRLEPGQMRQIRMSVDPRLEANWDQAHNAWVVPGGACALALGRSEREIVARAFVTVKPATLNRD